MGVGPWGSAQLGLLNPTDFQQSLLKARIPPEADLILILILILIKRLQKDMPPLSQLLSCSDGPHTIIHFPSVPH